MNKQDCEIVRDLLPLYIDHVTSEVTSDYVKKHLAECESCSRIYESSKESIQLPNSAEFNAGQAMDIKKLKKSLIRKNSWILAALIIIVFIIITALITDTAKNGAVIRQGDIDYTVLRKRDSSAEYYEIHLILNASGSLKIVSDETCYYPEPLNCGGREYHIKVDSFSSENNKELILTIPEEEITAFKKEHHEADYTVYITGNGWNVIFTPEE